MIAILLVFAGFWVVIASMFVAALALTAAKPAPAFQKVKQVGRNEAETSSPASSPAREQKPKNITDTVKGVL